MREILLSPRTIYVVVKNKTEGLNSAYYIVYASENEEKVIAYVKKHFMKRALPMMTPKMFYRKIELNKKQNAFIGSYTD